MKHALIAILVCFPVLLNAQTRAVVPNANNEGKIGDTYADWGYLYVDSLYMGGVSMDVWLPSNPGVTAINGVAGDIDFVATSGFSSSNSGSTIYLSLFTNDFVVGSNIATYRYTGGDQYFQVPNTVTNMKAWLWGGAGGSGGGLGGGGGYTEVSFKVLPFEILTIVVGGGGSVVTGMTNNASASLRTYPEGGRATSVGNRVGAGGGRSQILRGSLSITNVNRTIAVAGGGGGGRGTGVSPSGGGESGTSGEGQFGGTGGGAARALYSVSSTNVNVYTNDSVVTTSFTYNIVFTGYVGGTTGVTTNNLLYTNTAGSLFYGGDGGILLSGISNSSTAAGGGGDGYYGGGGAMAIAGSTSSGGGGNGWINTNLQAFGRTIRAVGASPAGSEFIYYITGTGVAVANTNGGNGLIILQY
jgi:hypothetical protein